MHEEADKHLDDALAPRHGHVHVRNVAHAFCFGEPLRVHRKPGRERTCKLQVPRIVFHAGSSVLDSNHIVEVLRHHGVRAVNTGHVADELRQGRVARDKAPQNHEVIIRRRVANIPQQLAGRLT